MIFFSNAKNDSQLSGSDSKSREERGSKCIDCCGEVAWYIFFNLRLSREESGAECNGVFMRRGLLPGCYRPGLWTEHQMVLGTYIPTLLPTYPPTSPSCSPTLLCPMELLAKTGMYF